LFTKQFELAKLDESREGAVIQVLDMAEPPEKKAKPEKTMIAIIATLASGFALFLFVFIRKTLKNNLQNEQTKLRMISLKASWNRAMDIKNLRIKKY
jgi:tyrosine-protein kinase Etk/Wzc